MSEITAERIHQQGRAGFITHHERRIETNILAVFEGSTRKIPCSKIGLIGCLEQRHGMLRQNNNTIDQRRIAQDMEEYRPGLVFLREHVSPMLGDHAATIGRG
ncbi:hypothetical protein AcidC75_10800 [Acidisoma sp. C75]